MVHVITKCLLRSARIDSHAVAQSLVIYIQDLHSCLLQVSLQPGGWSCAGTGGHLWRSLALVRGPQQQTCSEPYSQVVQVQNSFEVPKHSGTIIINHAHEPLA